MCRYNYEDYNDFKNIEKIYESQSIYGNSGNNSNTKVVNNIRSQNDLSSDKKHLTENNNSGDNSERKRYTNKEFDVTIIEIRQEDNFEFIQFLEVDENLDNYKNKHII